MQADLHSLTSTLAGCRNTLLTDYDPEALHDLRVSIRRIRTHLKALSDKTSRKRGKRWQRLMSVTNGARDWDVLWRDLEAGMGPAEFGTLSPALAARRGMAREHALAMLKSRDWDRNWARWQRYLDDYTGQQQQRAAALPLDKAERRLTEASYRALTRGRDKDWHTLRIAGKELRYTLEAQLQACGSDRELERRVAWCKQLQEALGNWHDCVVQRGLLEDLQRQLEAARDEAAVTVLSRLLHQVAVRQRSCLGDTRALLRSPPLPAPAG